MVDVNAFSANLVPIRAEAASFSMLPCQVEMLYGGAYQKFPATLNFRLTLY